MVRNMREERGRGLSRRETARRLKWSEQRGGWQAIACSVRKVQRGEAHGREMRRLGGRQTERWGKARMRRRITEGGSVVGFGGRETEGEAKGEGERGGERDRRAKVSERRKSGGWTEEGEAGGHGKGREGARQGGSQLREDDSISLRHSPSSAREDLG